MGFSENELQRSIHGLQELKPKLVKKIMESDKGNLAENISASNLLKEDMEIAIHAMEFILDVINSIDVNKKRGYISSMNRVTYKHLNGTWGLTSGHNIQDVPPYLYGALCKLKDYEETGLSPDEVECCTNAVNKLLVRMMLDKTYS